MYLCPPLLLTTVVTLLSFHFRAIFCENSSANMYIYSQNMKYSFVSKGTNTILVFCGFVPPHTQISSQCCIQSQTYQLQASLAFLCAFLHNITARQYDKGKRAKEQVSVLVSAWALLSKELKFFYFINQMECKEIYGQFGSSLRQWCLEWYVELIVIGTHSKQMYS